VAVPSVLVNLSWSPDSGLVSHGLRRRKLPEAPLPVRRSSQPLPRERGLVLSRELRTRACSHFPMVSLVGSGWFLSPARGGGVWRCSRGRRVVLRLTPHSATRPSREGGNHPVFRRSGWTPVFTGVTGGGREVMLPLFAPSFPRMRKSIWDSERAAAQVSDGSRASSACRSVNRP